MEITPGTPRLGQKATKTRGPVGRTGAKCIGLFVTLYSRTHDAVNKRITFFVRGGFTRQADRVEKTPPLPSIWCNGRGGGFSTLAGTALVSSSAWATDRAAAIATGAASPPKRRTGFW